MMWSKIKKIYSYIFRVCLALIVILFMVFIFFTLASKELNQNTEILTFISLVAVLFSMPGIINTLAEEVNPKKKVYKLSCKCPNCRHLIQMDMKEE
ncbi:hypothetical protein [Neobacillus drentensis]|uniref:hypothetical protein n=1 Tax=Neobacillus drentensis TaxID=220684 RepID=UPI00286749D3|nr:hypothetical protein [Neobacillus drentensis]MDR7239142.1 putative membrane protein [Neobacillus drentensis]